MCKKHILNPIPLTPHMPRHPSHLSWTRELPITPKRCGPKSYFRGWWDWHVILLQSSIITVIVIWKNLYFYICTHKKYKKTHYQDSRIHLWGCKQLKNIIKERLKSGALLCYNTWFLFSQRSISTLTYEQSLMSDAFIPGNKTVIALGLKYSLLIYFMNIEEACSNLEGCLLLLTIQLNSHS